MKFKEIFERVRNRVRQAQQQEGGKGMLRSVAGSLRDERLETAFQRAREMIAPASEQLPVDFQLRQSGMFRRAFERLFPISHVFRMSWQHNREFLEDFMPLSNDSYIGRGSYKFVYRLPWRMVLKVGKLVLPSDPLFGSQFREVDANQDRFLTAEEQALQEYLGQGRSASERERLRFKFNRLALERYQYTQVREGLPDLVLPTRFFMGIRYRKRMFGKGHYETVTPMDSQIMLVGKHLKELARAARKTKQSWVFSRFSPRYDFEFDSGHFENIKKKVLIKITEDFRRLIRFTEDLARRGLILDIHSENIIITLPEFELKIFDFHIFDQHLYEPSLKFDRPEKDHIEVIEKFIEALGLNDRQRRSQ